MSNILSSHFFILEASYIIKNNWLPSMKASTLTITDYIYRPGYVYSILFSTCLERL